MNRVDILMTAAVNAWNVGSASLAVHEVDRFPNTVEPGVISNAEGTSQCVSSFNHVRAWLPDCRKIQQLIVAQRSGGLFDRFGQNEAAGLLVDNRKLVGSEVAGNSGLGGSGSVAAVAERNPSRCYVPSLHVIGYHTL